jgi:hypothetical protein
MSDRRKFEYRILEYMAPDRKRFTIVTMTRRNNFWNHDDYDTYEAAFCALMKQNPKAVIQPNRREFQFYIKKAGRLLQGWDVA